jgi:ABC-type uncharacterized transport system ATPase component
VYSDEIHALERLTSRVRNLSETSVRVKALRGRDVETLVSVEAEMVELSAKVNTLLKVNELFRSLMDRLVTDQVKVIESIVTEGLGTIFHDQKLSFEAEIGSRYNKIAIDFRLKQGEGALAIVGKPLESFGGGPSSVASLLLRVLTLLRLGRKHVLFLDETLAAVSDEYVDLTGKFLRRLASNAGVDILLVTHKQSFLEHANRAYQGSEVTGPDDSHKLTLKAVKN